MVKIVYHRDLNRVEVQEHAKSGEYGHDLVCASVSILVYTLASFVENMKRAGQVYNPTAEIKEGDAVIYCSPPTKYRASVTLVFDSICAGFELLARDYPDNVSYKIRGKNIKLKEKTNDKRKIYRTGKGSCSKLCCRTP